MTAGCSVTVRGWCAWTPDRPTRDAWRAWAGAPAGATGNADAAVPPPALPMALRRRTSALGQRLVATALACGDATRTARYVLASRHGELWRTVGIIDALHHGELPSPAEFSLSVHHGLAGLLSIHQGNRRGHTALAAGSDSFGFGLMEAAACVAETPEEPVLLLYGDAPMPDAYAPLGTADETALPLAVAVHFGGPGDAGERIVMNVIPGETETGAVCADPMPLAFLRFLASGAEHSTSIGARLGWAWHRVG